MSSFLAVVVWQRAERPATSFPRDLGWLYTPHVVHSEHRNTNDSVFAREGPFQREVPLAWRGWVVFPSPLCGLRGRPRDNWAVDRRVFVSLYV